MKSPGDLTGEGQFQTVLDLLGEIIQKWQGAWRDKSSHRKAAMAAAFFGHGMVARFGCRPSDGQRKAWDDLVIRMSSLSGQQGWDQIDSGDHVVGAGPVAATVKGMLDMAGAALFVGVWAQRESRRNAAIAMYLITRDWLISADELAGDVINWQTVVSSNERSRTKSDVLAAGSRLSDSTSPADLASEQVVAATGSRGRFL